MSCDPVLPPDELANAPVLTPPAPGLTRLVTDPSCGVTRTDQRETDAVGALRRGLAEYLSQVELDIGGGVVRFARVFKEWAEPNDDNTRYPSLAVLAPEDIAFDGSSFTPVIVPTDVTPSGAYLVKYAEIATEITLRAVCETPEQRTAVAALLEDALNPVEWMHGFRLDLPHYFGERATFQVVRASWQDDAELARQNRRPLVAVVDARVSVVRARKLPTLRPALVIEVDGVRLERA